MYVTVLCVENPVCIEGFSSIIIWHQFLNTMASTTNTISHGWREKGNTSYRNFRDSNSAERQKNYLESALKSYYRAYETADSNVDKSNAAKNYGIASWRLANMLIELDEKDSLCEFRRREAISYFSKVRLVC